MPYSLQQKLVVAVASSAIFDLAESDRIYREQGLEAYRDFQRSRQDDPLGPGIAFPFIRRLLSLNPLPPDESLVEVILLSRNDPDTGLRIFKSMQHHRLDVTRGAFLAGKSPHRYIEAFNACLFLSGNREDVQTAVQAGHPAGLVMQSSRADDAEDLELRVAFDFDGVLANDEAETVFQQNFDLAAFHDAEQTKVAIPHSSGPLLRLFRELANLKNQVDQAGKKTVRMAIVTARNAPSHERAINTLRQWGVIPDEMFFLGGIDKHRILQVFRPHLFFDDQLTHLENAADYGAMVHVPFGIKNQCHSPAPEGKEEKPAKLPHKSPSRQKRNPYN